MEENIKPKYVKLKAVQIRELPQPKVKMYEARSDELPLIMPPLQTPLPILTRTPSQHPTAKPKHPTVATPEQPHAKKEDWSCGVCTFKNKYDATKCEVCMMDKGKWMCPQRR